MTSATFIWHNLGRNKVRTVLTVASVAVSLFLFTLLRAAVASLPAVAASAGNQLRLVVRQKTTMTALLPLGHGARIAAECRVDDPTDALPTNARPAGQQPILTAIPRPPPVPRRPAASRCHPHVWHCT